MPSHRFFCPTPIIFAFLLLCRCLPSPFLSYTTYARISKVIFKTLKPSTGVLHSKVLPSKLRGLYAALSASWPSATPRSITQILPPPDFKSFHQTWHVCLLPGGFELQGPATRRQLQVHYQGSGIVQGLDLDVCWSRIFNSTPVDSSQRVGLPIDPNSNSHICVGRPDFPNVVNRVLNVCLLKSNRRAESFGYPHRSILIRCKWNAKQYPPHGLPTVFSIR
ncbi:hypothetical protein K438DRAFT_1785846 [Mycena galopus ATCC 62051]|nr:hypothetical protein K438DRAFT_1785846 [Mycena galopus ATCC 62051]